MEDPTDPSVALTDYQIDIYYDFDPAGPTDFGDLSGLGRIDLTAALNCTTSPCTGDPSAQLAEDSQNLLFSSLAFDFLIRTRMTRSSTHQVAASIPMHWATISSLPR